MKFEGNLYKNKDYFHHRHQKAKVVGLHSENKEQDAIKNMISPISIKVDLLGHSFSSSRSNESSLAASSRFKSDIRPFITDEGNMERQDSGKINHRSYWKTPIGVKIKVEIPSKSDDESEKCSYYNCRSIVNQELIKENMILKRKLQEANSQIEMLKEELEKEQKAKVIQICKFWKEKNTSEFISTNVGDYINKQLDKIK